MKDFVGNSVLQVPNLTLASSWHYRVIELLVEFWPISYKDLSNLFLPTTTPQDSEWET